MKSLTRKILGVISCIMLLIGVFIAIKCDYNRTEYSDIAFFLNNWESFIASIVSFTLGSLGIIYVMESGE